METGPGKSKKGVRQDKLVSVKVQMRDGGSLAAWATVAAVDEVEKFKICFKVIVDWPF